MRINIPRVHGETRKEKIIRTIALLLVFAAVIWAFTKNNERVVERLNRESSVYDETASLDDDQRKYIASFTRTMRDEFGVESRIQIFSGDFTVPELDNKTLYIGLAPPIGEAEVVFPPIMRRALGDDFAAMLVTEHLLPSFEQGDWPQELQIVLATIFQQLTELEQGDKN